MALGEDAPRYAELIEQVQGGGLDWDDFRIFLEVIRVGSFNRAAAKLNMTQPTVSRRLARLEKSVGARLFERDRRGPRLTFEGQRVFNDAVMAQSALTRAASAAARGGARTSGDCRILMSEALATYWMSRFIAPFCEHYPAVDIKLFGANDPTAEKAAASDLHVHYYEPAEAERGAVRLATLHYIPFASRAYIGKYGAPASLDDLKNHRLLDQALQMSDVSTWAHWASQGEYVRTTFFTNVSAGLGEAVRYGAGIAMMPTYASAVDECYVPLEIGLRYQMPISMTLNRGSAARWPARAVFDFLKKSVFDTARMPWFATEYVPPAANWPALSASLIAAAGKPDDPAA